MTIPDWLKKIKTPRVKGRKKIPIYAPRLNPNEAKYVNECLTKSWISSKGKYVRMFEKKFAEFCGARFAVSCTSGTAALFLALKSIDLNSNDEVIIPAFTMISTALAVSYCRAKIRFVDCNMESGGIDYLQIEKAVNSRTKAIIIVDVYGTPCNMEEVKKIAKNHKLHLIEDAAEAVGAEYHGKKIGSLSELTTFSLYANKVITTGEGGIITTNSRQLYLYLKKLNNYFFSKKRHFWHSKIGYNFRMTNIQAAIGVGQLEHADELVMRKQEIFAWYNYFLSPLSKYIIPLEVASGVKSNYWHVAYRIIDDRFSVMRLRNLLAEKGIETRGFFIPLHLQPPYWKKEYVGKFPVSEKLCQSGLLLPSGSGLDKDQVKSVCDSITSFFK